MELIEIILGPKITEKTIVLSSKGKYTFLINKKSSKNQIKKALKKIYKVDPIKINIIKRKGRKKVTPTKIGLIIKKRKTEKIAIVTLKKGQKIEGFQVEK